MVGFSAFVSVGSMLDVGWGDLIDYLGNDPQTSSIVIYMETIGNARALPFGRARSGAEQADHRHQGGAHAKPRPRRRLRIPGSLTGSDEVLEAAFRRSGVLRVNNIADLFYMAEVLSKQPSPKGPRLTILTNAGGPGVLATDALIMAMAASWRSCRPKPWRRSTRCCPPAWSHNNPIDIIGRCLARSATPRRWRLPPKIRTATACW